jgi:hypothetical protein
VVRAFGVEVVDELQRSLQVEVDEIVATHYEREWIDRFTIDDVNEVGRAGVGLD